MNAGAPQDQRREYGVTTSGPQEVVPTRRPRGPLSSSPELQRFIDAVIIPALLERLLHEHPPGA